MKAVVLSGFGPVGRAFVEHLEATGDELELHHGVRLRVAAVRASTHEVVIADGAQLPSRERWMPLRPFSETLAASGAEVFVQAIPSSPSLREIAAEEALTALRSGLHVVTATKSHLLTHWQELSDIARANGRLIRISGATGAALTAGDIARVGMRGLGCTGIRACPNGTATFVLDRLGDGASLDDAVREAQRLGIAEADPSADLAGIDSATKARLLAALLWGWDPASVTVRTEPITTATARAAQDARARGNCLRAVATVRLDGAREIRVRLEETEPGDPLHALVGPEKAVVFQSPDAGDVIVSGGRSSPLGAALSMVKDVLDVTAPRVGFG